MMEFWEQFLPNQRENKHLGPVEWDSYETYLFSFLSDFNGYADYNNLKLDVPEHMPIEHMASNPVTMAFLQFLIVSRSVKRVLEVGSYIGVSAIHMIQALPPNGSLITIEKGAEFAELANNNIKANTTSDQVSVVHGDGLAVLAGWAGSALVQNHEDLIFLDADKQHYDEYLEPLSKLLKPGGLLVVDDVLFHGDVLNETPTTDKGRGCKRLLEKAKTYDWPKVLLPLTNGLLLMEKPR